MRTLQAILGEISYQSIDDAMLRGLSRCRGGIAGSLMGTAFGISHMTTAAQRLASLDRLLEQGLVVRASTPAVDRWTTSYARSFAVYQITSKGKERVNANP